MSAKYDKLVGFGASNAPDPASDKYRHYVSDIGRIRDLIHIGDHVPLTLDYKGYDPVTFDSYVTEKFPYHFLVEFETPSGRISHRSIMYLDVLHARAKIDHLGQRAAEAKIPLPAEPVEMNV